MESKFDLKQTPAIAAIRLMTLGDIDRIMEIEREAYSNPWPEHCFKGEIMLNMDARYIVAETDGVISGYCGMWIMDAEAHITNVAVAAEHRRRRIADQLLINQMDYALWSNCYSIYLEVRRHNLAAQQLYSRYRFTVARVRERYYNDNDEDAIELRVEKVSDPAFLSNYQRIKNDLLNTLGIEKFPANCNPAR